MKQRQRGAAILETVLLWAFSITLTLAIGTQIQKGQMDLMRSTFDPLFSALNVITVQVR